MAYGTKYNFYYKSLHDKDYEFRIQEDGYSGAVTELTAMVPPAVRAVKGDNDELEDRIMRSECRVKINSSTDYSLMEFFTYDAKKYRGQIYCESSLYWQGYLSPDYYVEPYIPAPYTIELIFTDGLGQLKNIDYDEFGAVGEALTVKKLALWNAFILCISKAGNLLPFKEGIDIYEEHHNQTDADSMTSQTYFDIRRFTEDMSYYDVLDELLKAMGNARLWQQDGCWYLVSPNAMKADYVARNYTAAGVYVDYETISPKVETTDNQQLDASLNVFLDEPILTVLPAWKKFILNQNLGYDAALLKRVAYSKAGDFDVYEDEENIYMEVAESITNANYIEYNFGIITENTTNDEKLSFEFNAFGPHDVGIMVRVFLDKVGTSDYVLTSATSWDYATWVVGTTETLFNQRVDETFNMKMTNKIPATGTLKLRIYQPYKISGGEDYDGQIGFNFKNVKISPQPTFDLAEENTIETEINDEQNYIPDEFTMMLGDFIYPITRRFTVESQGGFTVPYYVTQSFDNQTMVYLGGLYYLDGATYKVTNYWQVKGVSGLKHLVNLVADEISVNHVRPMAMISGSLRCNFKPGTIVQAPISSDRLFILNRFSEDMYNDEWDVDMVEFSYAEQAYLKLRSGGYVTLRGGGKIKLRN